MVKNITIILGLVLPLVALANHSNNAQLELKMLDELQSENIIDQQQFKLLKNRVLERAPIQKNKTLGGTATINGHVQNTAAMNLDASQLTLYELVDGNRTFVDSTNTDAAGNYSFTALNAGIYLVNFGNAGDDYLDYQWDSSGNIVCTTYSCPDTITNQINLTDPGTINNIDFTVALGGIIQGTITDAITSAGVDTLYIIPVNTDININYNLSFSTIDPVTGTYSIRGIPDGDYRIYLDPNNFDEFNAYIPQVYGGPECNYCSRIVYDGIGTALTINSANTISNIDFSVNVGASISGNIVDNNTLSPVLELGFLMLFNDTNYFLGYAYIYGTNSDPLADGSYSIGGLLPGSYYVQGGDLGREFYQRELYDNRPCYYAGCNRGLGDAVVLSALENEVGINFLLNKGGKISGTITDASTGSPIVLPDNQRVWVEFYDATQKVIGAAFVKSDGSYVSARGLPAGDYSARTGSMFQGDLTSPYVNEKYGVLANIPCAGLACDLSTTNITVATEMTTPGIDFALTTGNSFSGTITDLSTSAPIAGINILVFKDMGAGVVKFANWAISSDGTVGNPPIGTFEISGLPDGTYYARTGYGSDLPFFVSTFHNIGGTAPIGWIDILYDSMPCLADCDVSLGTPIILPTVLKTTKGIAGPTINFTLSQGAIISGQVTDFIQQAPITAVSIEIYNDQGTFMGSSITDDQGNYITRGLPAGAYYLITKSYDLLLDVKYGNEFCPASSCNPLEAQSITLSELEQATAKNFILKSSFMHMFSNGFE